MRGRQRKEWTKEGRVGAVKREMQGKERTEKEGIRLGNRLRESRKWKGKTVNLIEEQSETTVQKRKERLAMESKR